MARKREADREERDLTERLKEGRAIDNEAGDSGGNESAK